MEISLFSLIAVYLVGQGMVAVLILFLASRGTGLMLQLFEQLDQNIAGAIQKLVEGGFDMPEPVNPIQAAIAQMLVSKMSDNAPHRDPTGQFVKKLE